MTKAEEDAAFRRREDEQLQRMAALSADEKLRWLRQAKEFAAKYAGIAAKPDAPEIKK